MSQDNIYRGRACEFYAAYCLEKAGLRTTHVDLPFDDLWCVCPKGLMYRVQVKSNSAPRLHSVHHRTPKYAFRVGCKTKPYSGVFIFVADDIKRIIAMKGDDVAVENLKMSVDRFTKDEQDRTIKEVFSL